MATYVLVHGGFAGGYQWRDVAALLRAAGHDAYTPTLTGLGERVHLARPEIDLALHVQDILNVLKYEKLTDVIMVGHSYAGMVIGGVAEKIPEHLRRLVYVDAFVPQNGESLWDMLVAYLPPSTIQGLSQVISNAGDGWCLPAPAKRSDGVDFPEGTPQPSRTMMQPLALRNPEATVLPRSYIYCSQNPPDWLFLPVTAACSARAREAGWDYHELPTSHAVFATMPRELTDILITFAR